MKCNVGVLVYFFLIKFIKNIEKFDDRPFVRFLPPRPFLQLRVEPFGRAAITGVLVIWEVPTASRGSRVAPSRGQGARR